MKASTLALLAVGGFAVWALTLRRDPVYSGVAIDRDTGWNLPPIYPDVTGSGAIDPTGAAWPGWQTPPFNPEGWPGGAITLPSDQAYAINSPEALAARTGPGVDGSPDLIYDAASRQFLIR